MANIGVFDVLGPIMIGPSSSHTAGAARLGKIAKTIVNKPIQEVTFLLHGSFRETYKGHGTDRALVAGILGMNPDDPRLKDALALAEVQGIKVDFVPADLGNSKDASHLPLPADDPVPFPRFLQSDTADEYVSCVPLLFAAV